MSSIWDDEVQTFVDRRRGPVRAPSRSPIAQEYVSDLAHSSPFRTPQTSGELALDSLPTLVGIPVPQPAPAPAAAPPAAPAERLYQGPLPGRPAAVIPFPAPRAAPVPALTAAAPAPAAAAARRLPLLELNQRPAPPPAVSRVRCHKHGLAGEQRCVSCDTPLCSACEHLLINGRTWCLRCGRHYRPTLISSLWIAIKAASKIILLLGVVFGTVQWAPLPLAARAVLAILLGVVCSWFLFLAPSWEAEVVVVEKRCRR